MSELLSDHHFQYPASVREIPPTYDRYGNRLKPVLEPEKVINLWVRAEQHQYNDETLELVPTERMNEYVQIVDEIAVCESALNEALGRRYQFFKEMGAYE